MVTRAELVRAGVRKTTLLSEDPFYLSKDFWELALNGIAFVADVISAIRTPTAVNILNAIVGAANSDITTKSAVTNLVKSKIDSATQSINTPINATDLKTNQAQLGLLIDLQEELNNRNGKKDDRN